MYSSRAMRSMSPHERAAVYKNQTLGAVWVLMGVGVLTLADPVLRSVQASVIPGLLAPGVATRATGQSFASTPHVVLAVLGGGLLVLLGILAGTGRARAALAGALLIAADWPLVLTSGRAGDFPELITSVLRLFYLWYVIRGYRAVGLRRTLREKMAQADAEYDGELKARAKRRGAKEDQPVDSRFEPEDEYQG